MPQNKPRIGRLSSKALFEQFVRTTVTLSEYGGLPSLENASQIWDDIWYVEAHNSTAIEGNTLVLSEVKKLLQGKRAVGGKKLKEYMEVQGYANAAKWVYSQARFPELNSPDGEIITVTEIRFIHEELMKLVWEVAPHKDAFDTEIPGSFRQHDIMPFDGGMTPPPFTEVMPQVSSWISWINNTVSIIDTIDIPLFLAKAHRDFESIHPFIDGNGRTGRLILNLLLVRLGYPPAIILKSRRNSYLTSLDIADKGNYVSLAEIICRAVLDNVHRFIVPKFAQNTDLVNLQTLVSKDVSYEALRKAIQRGRMKAQVGDDGIWYSSKEAVDEYLKSKFTRV